MSADFTIDYCGDYLHVRLADDYEMTPEALRKHWTAVSAACERYHCSRILSTGKLGARRLSTLDAYESARMALSIPQGIDLAVCFTGAHIPDAVTMFFQNVINNRGGRVQFFATEAEARAWLGIGTDSTVKRT